MAGCPACWGEVSPRGPGPVGSCWTLPCQQGGAPVYSERRFRPSHILPPPGTGASARIPLLDQPIPCAGEDRSCHRPAQAAGLWVVSMMVAVAAMVMVMVMDVVVTRTTSPKPAVVLLGLGVVSKETT